VRSRLAEGFASGIDAHLLTAVGLSSAAPEGVDPLKWLQDMLQVDRDALKKRMKDQRQSAKACNFGLLYGMSINGLHRYGIISYGLDWPLEAAAAQRAGWFELYPEILFWQCWSKLTYCTWPTKEWVRKGYDKVSAPSKTPVFKSKTLSGRPIFTTDSRKLLNYQDQGTGADMAMAALTHLGWLTPYLRAFVHDEIVLEVPEANVEKAVTDLERIMCEAAAQLLSPVGIGVETSVGDWWIH
jgi:DNA polymerase I-like protein with 3'-5' exonuclease and polymerase domains